MSTWKTYYIFYQNFQKEDELIKVIAAKMEEMYRLGKIEKWFYLRYWKSGPHLRLRYLSKENPDMSEVFASVKEFIAANPSPVVLTKDGYYENHKFDGEPIDIESLEWYDEGEIIEADYQPEYSRYGGEELMHLTETLFMHSSHLAVEVIKATVDKGFLLRFFFGMVLIRDVVERFASHDLLGIDVNTTYLNCVKSWQFNYKLDDLSYAEQFVQLTQHNRNTLQQIREALSQEPVYQKFLDEMVAGFTAIYQAADHQVVRSTLFSHHHMFCNRIGITPNYECAMYISLMRLGEEAHVG